MIIYTFLNVEEKKIFFKDFFFFFLSKKSFISREILSLSLKSFVLVRNDVSMSHINHGNPIKSVKQTSRWSSSKEDLQLKIFCFTILDFNISKLIKIGQGYLVIFLCQYLRQC